MQSRMFSCTLSTRRHNKVVTELAAVEALARLQVNQTTTTKPDPMQFLRAGQAAEGKSDSTSVPSFLDGARNWEIAMDLESHGSYPDVARESGMRPDIVLTKQVMLLEPTIPWESRIEEQYVFKMAKYRDLVAGLRPDGNPTRLLALEVA